MIGRKGVVIYNDRKCTTRNLTINFNHNLSLRKLACQRFYLTLSPIRIGHRMIYLYHCFFEFLVIFQAQKLQLNILYFTYIHNVDSILEQN